MPDQRASPTWPARKARHGLFSAFLSVALLSGLLTFAAKAQAQPRPDPRDTKEQPQKVIAATGVKPGMVIGEVGAGEGYFTFWLSWAVGPRGKVYANDIRSYGLDRIKRLAEKESIANIKTVLGTVDDPRFPKGALDMVFMVNVFHELAQPVEILAHLLPSLKPGAIVVIMDRDPAKTRGYPEHLYSREEMADTIGRSVFELVRTETFLPVHNLYILRARVPALKCP